MMTQSTADHERSEPIKWTDQYSRELHKPVRFKFKKRRVFFFSLRIFFSNKNRLLVWESVHPQPVTARNEQTYTQ